MALLTNSEPDRDREAAWNARARGDTGRSLTTLVRPERLGSAARAVCHASAVGAALPVLGGQRHTPCLGPWGPGTGLGGCQLGCK